MEDSNAELAPHEEEKEEISIAVPDTVEEGKKRHRNKQKGSTLARQQLEDDRERIPRFLAFLKWIKAFPYSIQTLLGIIIGSGLLIVPGLIDYFFYMESNPDGKSVLELDSSAKIGGYPLFAWSVYFSGLFAVLLASGWVVYTMPAVILRLTGWLFGKYYVNLLRPKLDYMMLLHWYISICITSLVAIIIRIEVFGAGGELFDKILDCIITAACFLLLEKWLLQLVAVGFHKKAYADRLLQSRFTAHVIDVLYTARKAIIQETRGYMTPRNAGSFSFSNLFTGPNGNSSRRSSLNNTPTGSVDGDEIQQSSDNLNPRVDLEQNAKATKNPSFKIIKKSFNFVNTMSELTGVNAFVRQTRDVVTEVTKAAVDTILTGSSAETDLRNREQARTLARKIFPVMSQGRDELSLDDISAFFATPEEAKKAFTVLDSLENGTVTEDEMEKCFLNYFEQKAAIEAGLINLGETIQRLDNILLLITAFIVLLICLSIFQISVTDYVVAAGSILIGLSFMIGSTLSSIFESVVFVFLYHPYDVGDKISLDGTVLTVKNLDLTLTTFEKLTGESMTLLNTEVKPKEIVNFRRSVNQTEVKYVTVPLTTPNEKLDRFQAMVNQFVDANPRKYHPGFPMVVADIAERDLSDIAGKLSLMILIKHKDNWQDWGSKFNRTNDFMWHVRKCLVELEVYGKDTVIDAKFDDELTKKLSRSRPLE